MMMALSQAATVTSVPAGPVASGTPTTAVATAPAPGFVDGMKLWLSPGPGTAITYVSAVFRNFTAAFSGPNLLPTLGVITPPLVLIAVLVGGGTVYSRRRR